MTTLNNSNVFSNQEINEIQDSNILLIWVPKSYGGLGYDLQKGLDELQKLAQKNGSLAWMVTLCAGANYFTRNLKPEVVKTLVKKANICFGGSGMIGGSAEKHGDKYLINGSWKYATGSIYLTHFTFNAKITKDGIPILDQNGQEQFKSFIISKEFVKIIEDWSSMGMKETQTHSFEISNQYVSEDFSFVYNTFYSSSNLDKIPFQIFTDLTFIVNYLGMAMHYLELSKVEIKNKLSISKLQQTTSEINKKIPFLVSRLEEILKTEPSNLDSLALEIHQYGSEIVKQLSHQILDIYLNIGLKASQEHNELNKVFKDFFTATQHVNFREK